MISPCCNRYTKWAIVWRSKNYLDGDQRHFMGEPEVGMTQLYRTRAEAREACERRWGYIRTRDDLKKEPHGWQMPQVVKVGVRIRELT